VQTALKRYPSDTPIVAKPLTPVTIATLKASATRYEVTDGGCAGLRVVVFPSRRKSFIVRYRFRGLQRKLTLGPVLLTHNGEGEPTESPTLDTPLSLAAARELAAKALRQAKAGQDPCATKQRQEQRAAECNTLENIAQEYLRRKEPGRTDNQLRSDLKLFCASALGRLPIDQITRGQFTLVLDVIADHNGPVRADRVRSSLNRALNWHAGRSDFVNPIGRGGRRTSISARARTRTLSDDELRALWRAAEQDKGSFGAFVRFTLLAATRRSESACLHHRELSDNGATWTIPGVRYKNGKDVIIPLSKAAQHIIASMPAGGDFVFGADGTAHSPASLIARRSSTRSAASRTTRFMICEERPELCFPAPGSPPMSPKCVSVMH
jgi:integrase